MFTHKHHTDVAYLACAKALLAAPDAVYPQFAGHNAGTIAAIIQMAKDVALSGTMDFPSSPAGAAEPALPGRRRSAPSGGSEPHAVGSVGGI